MPKSDYSIWAPSHSSSSIWWWHTCLWHLRFCLKLRWQLATDMGSMRCQQVPINRKSRQSWCQEGIRSQQGFSLSFVNTYIVEAILKHFDMENICKLHLNRHNIRCKEAWIPLDRIKSHIRGSAIQGEVFWVQAVTSWWGNAKERLQHLGPITFWVLPHDDGIPVYDI